MKKIILLLTSVLAIVTMHAQNTNPIPQINVTGTSEIKISPNYAVITIGAETRNEKSEVAKKTNDAIIANMLKTIKKHKIDDKHFKTNQVNLFKNRDYEKKKDFYLANQTFVIELYNLKNYDTLINDLIGNGANVLQGIELKSTEIEKYNAELRAKAVLDAKKKAEDFVKPLGQKVGKAILISDNSANVYMPRQFAMKANMEVADAGGIEPTLAIGEIVINTNVSISFELL